MEHVPVVDGDGAGSLDLSPFQLKILFQRLKLFENFSSKDCAYMQFLFILIFSGLKNKQIMLLF
jgi:hypothetical protein